MTLPEITATDSDSDISTNSWTLLDDTTEAENEAAPETQPEDNTKEDETETPAKKHSDGFLTFDEYMQERLLEYDYEQQEKPKKLKKKYKFRVKLAPNKMGISLLFAIILGISAFATLCSTLSQPAVTKEVGVVTEKYQPKLKTNIYDEFVQKLNETLKEVEHDTATKLRPFLVDKKGILNVTKPLNETKKLVKPIQFFPRDECELPKPFFKTPDKIQIDVTKSNWTSLKDILFHKHLHILISFMHIINLLALARDYVVKPSKKNKKCQIRSEAFDDLVKCNSMDDVRRYLFMQLPFRNSEIVDENKKLEPEKTKQATSVSVVDQRKEIIRNVLKTCPFFSEHVLTSVNGKSECERRFEELDKHQKKFESMKQSQKNRIRLLKQKFRNEVSHIRDTEEESEARAEKINRTSQMFIKKLKLNREKYLMEVKKVRELRQKVSQTRKKESSKDVSVGSYQVSLPPVYDYGERFKMIKEKFERENDQTSKEFKF